VTVLTGTWRARPDPRIKTGSAIVEAVRVRPALRREQAFVVELVGRRPGQYVGVAACVAARPVSRVRFSAPDIPAVTPVLGGKSGVAAAR
jgi:hypothetical protein